MSYTLQTFREKRFSTKIIVGKIRRKVPLWLYNIGLELRYIFFPKRCHDLAQPSIRYSDGSWINRGTTADLKRIQAFLLEQKEGLAVFQAGIGNSSLYRLLKNRVSRFVGVTIVQDELDYAQQQWPQALGGAYQAHLSNKYTGDIALLGKGFDYIVDNDISSYACCRHHFEVMLDTYRTMLKPDGAILVGFLGLGYFDMGFGLTERRMRHLAAKHGLSFTRGEACYFLKPI